MATPAHEVLPTPATPKRRIAYLLGAGATQAELENLLPEQMSAGMFRNENSLLLSSVSKRVCRDAKRDPELSRKIRKLISPRGLANVELFISLLEENRVPGATDIIERLKSRITKDISKRLRGRQDHCYLHKALFEFHQKAKDSEPLIGIISLNYDRLVDDAYQEVLGVAPNYCFAGAESPANIPLLKLHGGFGLKYRTERLPIIAPGVRKNYLDLPFNFIWGRALELLMECDVLRVVGCSLSQNDLGIIDLLFKAHIRRKTPILVQIIDFDPEGNTLKEQFGFFPQLECAWDIEDHLIGDEAVLHPSKGGNPFKIWLRAKIGRVIKEQADIDSSTYVRRVMAEGVH